MGLELKNPADAEKFSVWQKLVRKSIRCLREIDQLERDLAWWNEHRAEPGAEIRFDDEEPEHHRPQIRATLLRLNRHIPLTDAERESLETVCDQDSPPYFVQLDPETKERLKLRGLRFSQRGGCPPVFVLRGFGEPFFLEYAQALIGRGPWTRKGQGA